MQLATQPNALCRSSTGDGERRHPFCHDPKPPRAEVADTPVIQNRLALERREQICDEVCQRRVQNERDFEVIEQL